MDIASRMAEISAGTLKRSDDAEKNLNSWKQALFPNTHGNGCHLIAYDLKNGTPEQYKYIDALIPYLFGKDAVIKILNTTWLIQTSSLCSYQIMIELEGHFPDGAKAVIMRGERREISHWGLDSASDSWIAAQS